ncbi:hypothetical protein C8J57DRAFT_1619188 [Mycena rebaudengoi]|nr:hypothetical protein C8J57DRAFT_1619188 [Mycena rebaudengoi]
MSGIGLDSGSDEGHWLEIAVKYGDVPLAYEIIRLGASVLYKNHLGFSPLYSGCTLLRTLLPYGKFAFCSWTTIPTPNETHDGTSLLQLAYITASWDLIRALLIHGADPCPFATLSKHLAVPKKTDEPLYTSLTSELAGAERPPRLCPCGGGSALKNCHATFQAYPHQVHMLLRIQEDVFGVLPQKTPFGLGRAMERPGRVARSRRNYCGRHCRGIFLLGEVEASLQNDVCREMMSFEPSAEEAETKSREGLIDPAFAAAVKKTGFVPIPNAVRSMARNEWKHSMANWNTAVDHYIASGIDHRSAQAIEEAAKTVYCGRRCQEIARTAHRAACKSGTVQLQLLPDQVTHFAELRRITTFDLLR